MKTLMIANFLDNTGWSHAAIEYAMALNEVGVDLTLRNIKLNNILGEIPYELKKKLAGKSSGVKYDAVIQHVLPHMMEYNAKCGKNIGMYYSETSHFRNSPWSPHLNLMDGLILCSDDNANAARASDVTIPLNVVPIPCNVDKFNRDYQRLIGLPGHTEGKTIFYFVGEYNTRKNLEAFLRAFHMAFDVNDPVSIIIKSTIPGASRQESSDVLTNICENVRRGLKLYKNNYKFVPEILITESLSDEDVMRLHASCDCLVVPSRGEAWNIPAMDALGLGNPVICGNHGGITDFVDDENGWLVSGNMIPCFGAMDTFEFLYTADEQWFDIDILQLSYTLREAAEVLQNNTLREQKREQAASTVYNYTYEKIGEELVKALQ